MENQDQQPQEDKVFKAVQQIVGEVSNVDPDEIKLSDHLEIDLYLEVEINVPQIVTKLNQELEIEVEPETIVDFIKEAKVDPEKATVKELAVMIKEEMEFN
jgi:hypothetical protein